MAGISSKVLSYSLKENLIKYNGIELESDLETILYDALYRELNPQTGVWLQVDPKIEMNMENWSPYASNFNNPIRFKDPKGDCPTCEEVWKEVKYSVKSTLVSTFDNAVTVAREINQFNPLASLVEVITGTSSQSDFTQEKPRSMAVADFGVNSLMLFGSAPLRGMSIVNRGLNGSVRSPKFRSFESY